MTHSQISEQREEYSEAWRDARLAMNWALDDCGQNPWTSMPEGNENTDNDVMVLIAIEAYRADPE